MNFAHVSKIRKIAEDSGECIFNGFCISGERILSLSKAGFLAISKNNYVPTKSNSKQVLASNSISLQVFFFFFLGILLREQASNFVNNNSFIFEPKHHVST